MSDLRTDDKVATPSLFARMGGPHAIGPLVASLYKRIRLDPELAPYFHLTDMAAQRTRLADMLTDVLGGPQAPWLIDLTSAHRGRGITNRHFSLLCAHIIDALEDAGLNGDEADDIIEWVGRARSSVVEE